eukprot:scaffold2254_cov393-Prasinococcus_capsulatus_cf.AAC.12
MAALNAIATSQVLARSYNDSGISTRWLQSWPSDVFILNSNFPKTVSAISTFPSEWQQEVVKIGSWTLFFLAVHVWAQTHFKQDAANFHIKTALSRGVGFVPTAGVTIDMFNLFTVYRLALGHFIADLLWLAYALVTHNISPRKDLIAHHVLCLAGFSFMMDSPGAVMGAVALTTEMMPMTSAIGAFGRAVSHQTVRLATELLKTAAIALLDATAENVPRRSCELPTSGGAVRMAHSGVVRSKRSVCLGMSCTRPQSGCRGG